MGVAMATGLPDEERLTKAYSIIETTPEMEEVINKLRDALNVASCRLQFGQTAGRPLHSVDLSCFLDQTLYQYGIC